MAILSRLSRYQNTGLLLLRIGLGAMLIIVHGYPKLAAGPAKWAKLGESMSLFGLHDFPTFWGFMAAFAEGVGGLALLIGFLFRPACALLLITMAVAAAHHFHAGDGIDGASHAMELGVVFIALFVLGPGRYSIDRS